MILTKMKGYLLAAWSLLLSLGTFLLTFSLMRSGKNKRERKEAEARLDHVKKVVKADKDIDIQTDVRTDELVEELRVKKTSSELSNPNDW